MSDYISKLDEIDKWLFDSFGILPGCGSSQEKLRHTTARMVAEVLWPKKESSLTWEDIARIVILADIVLDGNEEEWRKRGEQAYYEEVLKAFNNKKK